MHYDIDYRNMPRQEADDKAIADTKEYLSERQWETVLMMCGQIIDPDSKTNFQSLNIGLGFAGVSGYPVHAIGRRYCLKEYREWMADEKISGVSIKTDEEGFPV